MTDRADIRNAASTIAHLWLTACTPDGGAHIDQLGIERLLLAFPEPTRVLLCAYVVRQMHCQAAAPADIGGFLSLLADIAGIEED